MSGDFVSWGDYEAVEGMGLHTQNDLNDLSKALLVGNEQNPPSAIVSGDGFALRTESLEKTLKNVTYKMENVKFWRQITKKAAYNTSEEYNSLLSYGENPDAGWIAEGALPNEDDSTYERKISTVKFLGTTRRVSHVAQTIRPAHGNILAQEGVNGTMHLLKIIERALFFARSDLSALQFDGFEKLIEDNAPSTNIIDMRGKPLTEDVLTDGALIAQDQPNYGQVTDLFCTPTAKSDLVKAFFPKERVDLFSKPSNGLVGMDIKGFTSPAGDVRIQSDVFIDDGGSPTAAIIGEAAKVPSTPTISTAATSPVDSTAQFVAADAGDYFYKIVACNRFGRAAAIDLVAGPTAVTVAAGDKVTFGITPGGVLPEWWEVYRTKKDAAVGTTRLILRVPHSTVAAELVINDTNAYLPGTTTSFLLQQNEESMIVKQLAPMIKVPLATIDSSIRFMLLCYMVPQLFTPGKNILYQNVGRAIGSVGS